MKAKLCLAVVGSAASLLSGCKSSKSKYYNLIDTLIVYTDNQIDPFDHLPPSLELSTAELESLRPYLERTEVIDTTYEKGALVKEDIPIGHHYFFRHPWVPTDVLSILYLDLSAPERGLERVPDRLKAWYFPEDYPQRAVDTIREIRQYRDRN